MILQDVVIWSFKCLIQWLLETHEYIISVAEALTSFPSFLWEVASFEVAEVVLETSAHLKDFDISPTFDGQWIIEREEDGGCFRVFISNKQ